MAIGLFFMLGSAALAGCPSCGGGQACESACGNCDACCQPCPPCGAGSAGCGGCIHPLAPVEWVLRLLGGSLGCGGGCCGGCSGETYWGDCGTGGCSSCDVQGNYVGRGPAAFGPTYAAPAAGCGCAMRTQNVPSNGYVQRTQNVPSNGYVQRAPATPNQGRSNGYARYPARGQAMPTAYYGQPAGQSSRVVSVTEQVVPSDQVPQATAARPVRQYQQYAR
jgi:hypothetical protein